MTAFWLQSHHRLTSWSAWVTYLPGLIVFLPRWRPDSIDFLRRSPSQELSDILTDYCRPSPILLSYLEHVLLSSLPSPLIIISSVLVTCPELSIYFLVQSTRPSYRFSSLPINTLPYSLLSSFQINLSSKSVFQLIALFSYIWPILIPSLYCPFLPIFGPFRSLIFWSILSGTYPSRICTSILHLVLAFTWPAAGHITCYFL